MARLEGSSGNEPPDHRPEAGDRIEREQVEPAIEGVDANADSGYRERPLQEFRDTHPNEYTQVWTRTSKTEAFQDPEATVRQINPDLTKGAEFQVNCADCSRAFERTWRGDREEAAGRVAHYVPGHGIRSVGESPETTEEWAGEEFEQIRDIDDVRRRLEEAGSGSSAIVHARFTYDSGKQGRHAFNVVNHEGDIRVVDAQLGRAYDWKPGQGHPKMNNPYDIGAMGWDQEGESLW